MVSTTTTIVSYTNPSLVGYAVTFSVSVDSPDGGVVTLTDAFTSPPTTLAILTLTPNGGVSTVNYATNSLTLGTHYLTASFAGDSTYAPSVGSLSQAIVNPIVRTTYLPSFALIGTYSPTGDGSLPPAAEAVLVPTSTVGEFVVPSTPIFVLWTLTNIVQVRITGDNGVDPAVDSGLITTTGLTSGNLGLPGFTHDIVLTFRAYDTIGHVAVTQLLPVDYASGALTGIVVSPSSAVVQVGNTQQYSAVGVYADSSTATFRDGVLAWSSSNTGEATVDSTGLATAVSTTVLATISAEYDTITGTASIGVTNMETRIPTLVDSEGLGVSWENTAAATAAGIGTSQATLVYSYSITGGVATFTTTSQSLQAGQRVVLSHFGNGLDGLTVTVLSSGLTSTSFEATVTLGNLGTTLCAAAATPTTSYALGRRRDMVAPAAGHYALYVPGGGSPAVVVSGNPPFGFMPVYLETSMGGNIGANGYPFGTDITSTGSSVPAPTLPVGAVVTAVYTYLQGTHTQINGSGFNSYTMHWSGGTQTFTVNGSPSTALLGTDPSVISTAYFKSENLSSLETFSPGYQWADVIEAYGFEVIYTLSSGSPIPAGQLQNLASKLFNFALPSPSTVTGIQFNFASGISVGSGPITLTVQPTIAGTPVGTAKTQVISSWSGPYTLGGSTDLWGISSPLMDTDVNDSGSPPTTGFGIIVSATLPDGTQINLNEVQSTLWYY